MQWGSGLLTDPQGESSGSQPWGWSFQASTKPAMNSESNDFLFPQIEIQIFSKTIDILLKKFLVCIKRWAEDIGTFSHSEVYEGKLLERIKLSSFYQIHV